MTGDDRGAGPTTAEALAGADIVAAAVASADTGAAPVPDGFARDVAAEYGIDLAAVIAAERMNGRAGELVRVPTAAPPGLPRRFLLVGTGSGAPGELRRAAAALARAGRGCDRVVTSLGASAGAAAARAVTEGLLLGGYGPPFAGAKDRTDSRAAAQVTLLGRYPAAAVAQGRAAAQATLLARDLANIPSTVKGPAWMADQACGIAADAGLEVAVRHGPDLARDGFGGLLAVGGGSARGPLLVQLDYRPDDGAARREGSGARRGVVLIGKGITFDTGGLAIKTREGMVPMKTDMAGAAVVLAVLGTCRALGVRRPVTGVLALAENVVSGSAYRPGDVVRHYGGRTSEVVNTDAEGRLVLADALAYADAVLAPDVVVDIATLTGAASLGLGRRHAPLFATDERLAAALVAAGDEVGERVWRMPLVEDYRAALDSDIADLKHAVNDPKLGGGSITAALFLREFTGGRKWAHLDIAGTGRADKDEHEVTSGATGYGARLLLRWLESLR